MKQFVKFALSMLAFFAFLDWLGIGEDDAWRLLAVIPFATLMVAVSMPAQRLDTKNLNVG